MYSEFFLAVISLRSPRYLFIFIIWKKKIGSKYRKKVFCYILKKKTLVVYMPSHAHHCQGHADLIGTKTNNLVTKSNVFRGSWAGMMAQSTRKLTAEQRVNLRYWLMAETGNALMTGISISSPMISRSLNPSISATTWCWFRTLVIGTYYALVEEMISSSASCLAKTLVRTPQ